MENLKRINRILSKKVKLAAAVLLCFASILALMPFYTMALGQTTSTVSGSVTDSSGVGLSNVAVELRTTGGALITSASTNAQGNYVLVNVAFGTYSLQIGKAGYAKVTQTVQVNVADQQLGAIVLSSALSLSANNLGFTSNPGDRIQIPVTATYSGEGRETVALSVSAPQGWTTRILQGSYEVSQVSLQSGQPTSLQLEVTLASSTARGATYNVALIATGTTTAFLNVTVQVNNQTAGGISGRFVDDKKAALGGVTVEASSSSGTLIKSTQSSSDGTFSLELAAPGNYVLTYKKAGYVEGTPQMIMLTASNPSSTLLDITLTRTIWLTSSIISVAVNPGDKLVLPFTVSNMGTNIEPVSFSAYTPKGWQAKVMDGNYQIDTLALNPSENANLQLEVNVPLGTNGTYSLQVSATGNITTTLNFTAIVGPPAGVLLGCSYPGKSSTPGDNVKFQIKLSNPFSVSVRFNLTIENLPPNWTAMVKSAAGDFVTEFVLGPNEVADLIVEATSLSSDATDMAYTFSVKAEAIGQNMHDVLPLTTTLTELATQITMSVRMPEIAIQAGNHVDYAVIVSNMGADDRTLVLNAILPDNWKAVFKTEGTEITRLHLYSGNTSTLTVQLLPPNTVNLGVYLTEFQVKSESGTILAATNLTTTVTGSYSLNLGLNAYQINANSGESTTFTANVVNTGLTTLTNVVVNVTLQEDSWEYTVSPPRIESIKPHESATFNIEVKTGQNTVAGDYMVDVSAKCDQTETKSQNTVRITVSASTSWGIWGVGIAIFFIVVLALVFWKFKRR